jgi:hypothetical protein
MANKNQMENFIIENHLSIINEAKSDLNFIHLSNLTLIYTFFY